MKIHELGYGETKTLRLIPTDEPPPILLNYQQGREIHLILPQDTEEILVRVSDRPPISVKPLDDTSRQTLQRLRELRSPRLEYLSHEHIDSITRQPIWTVETRRFQSLLTLERLQIGLDERTLEQLQRKRPGLTKLNDAVRWLDEELTLPPFEAKAPARCVVTGDVGDGMCFRLLGRSLVVDVEMQNEHLYIKRVTTEARQNHKRPLTLLSTHLEFIDASIASRQPTLRAQLEQLVKDADSYIKLWRDYQEMEHAQILQRMRELGWIQYKKTYVNTDGNWVFTIGKKSKTEDFYERFVTQDRPDLEAAPQVPEALLKPERAQQSGADDDDSTEEEAPPTRQRSRTRARRLSIGKLVSCDPDAGTLTLEPLDEYAPEPSPTGALFASFQGDDRRLERRERAMERLKAADGAMPQIALILEGQPAPTRRRDAVKPISAATARLLKRSLTATQRKALDIALNTPDIALIQGPPGTGKTTVITAILARLAELGDEQAHAGGRTLLTSFQHDAVDNAVGRSRVMGLPPARFGGRRNKVIGAPSPESVYAERWGKELRDRLLIRLDDLDEVSPLGRYRRFRYQIATLLASPRAADTLRELVLELLKLPTTALPEQTRRELRTLIEPHRNALNADSFEREQNLRYARGLRTTPEQFGDDGPAQARAAQRNLEALLEPAEASLLERATAHDVSLPFPELQALQALQERLLKHLLDAPLPQDPPGWPSEVYDALNGAVRALREAMLVSRGAQSDALEELRFSLEEEPDQVQRVLREYASVYAATCQQAVSFPVVKALQELGVTGDTLSMENVIVDEAGRANPLDLFIPMALARRRIILVGDHRQLPHMLEPDVERELRGTVSEACQQALTQSLFERLFNDLRAREASDGVQRVITLDDQFRMHPTLGELVSNIFYNKFGENFQSPREAADFNHSLAGYQTAQGKAACMAWKHIAHEKGKEEKHQKSWYRRAEASWIAQEVKRLLELDIDETIGVITFYKSQVDTIMRALARENIAESQPEGEGITLRPEYTELERHGERVERLRVGTVDAFQGMEFDLVFLSITRSNQLPESTPAAVQRRWGHLGLPNRLCVAMSRQRKLLITVGDREMFTGPAAAEAVPGLARLLTACKESPDGILL